MRQNNPAKKFILDLLAGGYRTYEDFLNNCTTHIVLSGLSEDDLITLVQELESEGKLIRIMNSKPKNKSGRTAVLPNLILLCSTANAGAILSAQDRIAEFDANFAG